MNLKIFKDYQSLSMQTAEILVNLIKNKPDSMFCLASGDTPKLALHYFVDLINEKKIDTSQAQFVGLDEWVGISPSTIGSCHHFFQHSLINPLNLTNSQVHLFDAMADDLEGECKKMDEAILSFGGLDIVIVGVGLNGHIGFNEPGVSPHLYSHVIQLDETTRIVGQKYFNQATKLEKGITLGLQHLMEAKNALLLASGIEKAEIMKITLQEEISSRVPATMIRRHLNGLIYLDKEAASLLSVNEY
jgi:glucosamine-6-phosphate isomerase